jgi:tetratricopeptide (TPR) repeat protein
MGMMVGDKPGVAREQALLHRGHGRDRSRERRCRALLRDGLTERALEELEVLVAEDEGNAWAHAHLGDSLCVARGEHEAALEHLNRAIELDATYGWAFAHRGATLVRLDRFDDAAADLRRALELKPSNLWARALLCRVHQLSGRYDAALEELDVMVRAGCTLLPDWRAERGLLHTLAGRYEQAHACYLEALAHDGGDPLALYNAAVNLRRWRGPAAAAAWIERARAQFLVQPSSSRVTYELGGLLALEGRADAALAHLALAIDAERGRRPFSPSSKRARVDLAWVGLRDHPRFLVLTRLRA